MDDKMQILEVIDVYKSYKNEFIETEILKGISIKFTNNALTTITGPSGAGKSTLLHLLGALDVPTRGDVLINGISTKNMKDSEIREIRRKKIGFIFQSYNLLAGLNVVENITVPLLLNKIPVRKKSDYVDKLLELVGLKERANYPIYKLSGGEQQRVAIARALVTEPDLIIADEPTGNLDTQKTIEILDIFKKLRDEKKTIVLVTHNENVNEYGDYKIKIKDGLLERNR